jgi:hypothetical protein
LSTTARIDTPTAPLPVYQRQLETLRPEPQVEERTFLCKDGYTEAGRNALFEVVEDKKVWTKELREIRFFRTEELAEKVAFMLVVMNAGLYVGLVSVVRVPGRKDLVKVRRRSPEKVNVGRWPHSSGRRKS